jgi:hypothetical protein
MANILDYMKNTTPEIARGSNSKSTRNEIRKEARECGLFLQRVKETAQQIAYNDTVKAINDDISFLCKWMIMFGVSDEEEE